MTMKKITACIASLAIACAMALAPVNEAGSESFCSPAVITADAASSNKLVGECRLYVTSMNPIDYAKKNVEIVIKVNTEEDVKEISSWCTKVSIASSGCGNGEKVVKYGKELISIFDIKGGTILYFLEKTFSNMNGVSKSAAQAAADIQRIHNANPRNGIVLRITQKNNWKVAVNGTPVKVTAEPKTEVSASAKTKYYPAVSSKYNSVVDALNSIKVNSSYKNREKIYNANKLYNSYGTYRGSAKQNTALLKLLQKGLCIKV